MARPKLIRPYLLPKSVQDKLPAEHPPTQKSLMAYHLPLILLLLF